MFTLRDSLSLPGDPAKQNEDAFGGDSHAAVVFDGATMLGDRLMPGPSDAAWIAQFGARRLIAHLKDEAPKKALRLALSDTEKSFVALRRHAPEEQWQMPCASMMLAFYRPLRPSQPQGSATATSPTSVLRTRGGGGSGSGSIEFLWFGDCTALVKRDDKVTVVGEAFDKRAAESARARKLAKEKNLSPASGLSRPEFLGHLRAARNRVNSGQHWLFTPDKRAATHAARKLVAAEPGAQILLASDGFLALACDYGAYDAAGLIAAAKLKGLAALGAELRAIEESDALGDKFARFKKSDDATALLLEVS